ncbi:MAG: methyltransferase domain-containing protein [Geminicoccaceae bacterium]|nr:methyltransferase domain-containing protein [Geminicoccaceae bacterium]MCS7267180.1 methyltransferase domain-containing protein [Geminicoccaceae bacterium]MCX7630286.1 methyltransferase domain-containing protein [Geminicoccaceae bacterium]MDW8124039.1 methyltransferase domain-containing protein [Geminicoccaceae bacterium]MDW8341271.1 methyltransferase domain-containing protein [Geminicoccaceae bacterium]
MSRNPALDARPLDAALVEAQTREVRRAYERIAPVYDLLDALYERSWKRRLRAELFAHALPGKLLDVGVGTGCNMPFYPPNSEVVGIDASPAMLARARARARRLGKKVQLLEMNLLELAFPDGCFDTVVATFVLLCLPDELQLPALRELARVTRPGGRILLLDYHRSSRTLVRWWMRMLSAWLRWAFAARFDPATERHLAEAGLEPLLRAHRMGDAVTMLVLTPASRARPG